MDVELAPASTLEPARLAALVTAGYGDYLVPIHVDAAQLSSLVRAWDLDLDASRVALRDGEPVGLSLLGLRGEEAWVGAVGVVPAARRTGVGEALVRAVVGEARGRGATVARLEVIRENVGAIALYERLGFERVRDLEVWSVPSAPARPHAVPVPQARALVAGSRRRREPWQRADATLDNLDDLDGLAAEDAAAVVRVAAGSAQLLQAAGLPSGLEAVVRAAASLAESLVALNVDPADPLSAALAAAGGRVDVTQHEYELALA